MLCLLASGHDKLLDPALGWNSHEMTSSGIRSEALILELSEGSVGKPKSETRQADMYQNSVPFIRQPVRMKDKWF